MADVKMDTFITDCLELNGILYVPHYSKDCYVGPGYAWNNFTEYKWNELVMLGAKKVKESLWRRPNNGGKMATKFPTLAG
jgi:hypothetical protein